MVLDNMGQIGDEADMIDYDYRCKMAKGHGLIKFLRLLWAGLWSKKENA